LQDLLLYFFLTLGASALFGVIGLGSSLLLIPLFTLLGVDFNFAKVIGLFINGLTTVSLTLHNVKSGLISFKEISFLIIVSALFALMGAYSSQFISQTVVKYMLIAFILLSVTLLYMGHKKETSQSHALHPFFLVTFVSVIAFIGGLIGVGGGAVYLPLLILTGITTKKSIAITSALIPIVSFSGFLTYTSFVAIDWNLLAVVGVAAFLGGTLGHKMMNTIKNEKNLKVLISVLLLGISVLMILKEIL